MAELGYRNAMSDDPLRQEFGELQLAVLKLDTLEKHKRYLFGLLEDELQTEINTRAILARH